MSIMRELLDSQCFCLTVSSPTVFEIKNTNSGALRGAVLMGEEDSVDT